MSLRQYETFAQFRTLHSEVETDGEFRDAHKCRALSMAATQQVRKGEDLLHLCFDTRETADEIQTSKAIRAPGTLSWIKAVRGAFVRPKKPGLLAADFYLRASITLNETFYFQIQTLRGHLDPDPSGPSGRTFELTGTGAVATYPLQDIPIDEGRYERLAFWMRGLPTATLGDTSDHTSSGTNNGQIASFDRTGLLNAVNIPANAWNSGAGAGTWATDHVCVVHDGPSTASVGNTIYVGQIMGVPSSTSLMLDPAPATNVEAEALRGSFFEIREMPRIRIVSLTGFTRSRTYPDAF